MTLRYVPQILPGAVLSAVPTGAPVASLVFPNAGGIQAIDKAGNLLTVQAGAGGSVSAVVTNALTSAVSSPLAMSHLLSSGIAANGIGVGEEFYTVNDAGSIVFAGRIAAVLSDVANGSEDSQLQFRLQVAGAAANALSLSASAAGTNVLAALGATNANLALQAAGTGVASLQGSDGTNIVAVSTNAAASRLGFYGVAPVAQQTGVAVTAGAIHAALVNLGLITA